MAEKEYIEREAVLSAIWKTSKEYDLFFPVIMLDAIKAVPAADVRPVVLCKNCKHNMANIVDIQDGVNINEGWNACQLTELYDDVEPDDFCSRGAEMKEES